MLKSRILILALLVVCSTPIWAHSHEEDGHALVQDIHRAGAEIDIDEDQDEVYEAVKQGLIKPFSELYATVDTHLNGRVIKVELEEDDDEWMYKLKLVHDNNIIRVRYDATTLEMVEIEGRNLQKVLQLGSQ
ncbi:PepSY domain-containing protein [Vibrio sonorensis]|uniref:PepSY domain-containing protein n=1 Tax=Vibrio sonorensis TaxID=1004316 RepID=UPI0008DA1518|nr:hypothetical protein [Vibrio sonorensis]